MKGPRTGPVSGPPERFRRAFAIRGIESLYVVYDGDERGKRHGEHDLGAADGLPPVSCAAVLEKLDEGSVPDPNAANSRTTWLATVNEDGSPHVTAVGALWLDGAFWFQTGAGTRKSRNVARDPPCSIAVPIRDADVVIEGDAVQVTDPSGVRRVCEGVGGPRLAGGT